MAGLQTLAVVMEKPQRLRLDRVGLSVPGDQDLVVEIAASGISTGTEKLLWTGRMPHFPGMGYPLIPGYESVGKVLEAGAGTSRRPGDFVFVPGARCYPEVRSLFGGAAKTVVLPSHRALRMDQELGERAVLLALAATAHHALNLPHLDAPDLIIGHGVLGRLLARLCLMRGNPPPTLWERDPLRRPLHGLVQAQPEKHPESAPVAVSSDAWPEASMPLAAKRSSSITAATSPVDYPVLLPEDDPRRDYRCVVDASGDASHLDQLIARIAPGGQLVRYHLAAFRRQGMPDHHRDIVGQKAGR
ncbi:MAG: chlorophyll synthesis pathway protein BchC [Betaproteobacteria bacterium]|nr:chlorophyll synthesis pathway protein BchC [Betaproteobacteria bacterium]